MSLPLRSQRVGGERTQPVATPGGPDSTAGFCPLLRGHFRACPGPTESGPWRVGPAAFTPPGPSGVPAGLAREPRLLGSPECPLVLQLPCLQALPWRNVTSKPCPALGHIASTQRSTNGRVPGSWEGGRRRGVPSLPGPLGSCPRPCCCALLSLLQVLYKRQGPPHLATDLRLPCPAPRDAGSCWAEEEATSPSEVSPVQCPVHLSCRRTGGAWAAPAGPE